ncbi:MAG: citrate/2-methylcitrate synthase [Gemmatimonadales bacterium]
MRGWDDVIALQSSICRLSAEDGRLSYRGYEAGDLAQHSTFEETAFLLLHAELPTRGELRLFSAELKGSRKLPPPALKTLKGTPAGADPMSVLRLGIGTLALEDAVPLPPAPEAALRQGTRLIALAPTMVAAQYRLRRGLKPVTPRKALGLAADFLFMLTGEPAEPDAVRAFDVGLILRADNELNPSTFSARVTASTGADVYGAVSAAVSALAGPRHGWHARNVLLALEEIGPPENMASWLAARRSAGERIPGFGHQVYRGEDPRTAQLRPLAEARCARVGLAQLFRTARALEESMARESGQHAIVDYYLAVLYRALGIPPELFTAVFAVSRMPGWVAHILEQYRDERLIRPRAAYTGPEGRDYVSIRQRRP